MAERFERIFRFIENIYELNQDLQDDIEENFHLRNIKKGDFFLRADEDLSVVGFVNKGLLRYYYIDYDGKESTKFFSDENSFVLSFTAFSGKKSPFFIEAIEPCELLCIKTRTLKKLINDKWEWSRLYMKLLEQSYILKEEREADFLFYNASERYEKFRENNPSLILRVQQQHIASYLGITAVSLSRLLKER